MLQQKSTGTNMEWIIVLKTDLMMQLFIHLF